MKNLVRYLESGFDAVRLGIVTFFSVQQYTTGFAMRLTDVMTIWLTWSINHECDAVALSDKILNRRGNAMNKVIHPNNYNRGGVFLGATYDAVIGNPYGVDYDAGGMDPGLKRAVKVIKTTNVRNPNSDCPDEAHCVPVGAVCSKIIQEDLILDTRDYVNSFSSSLTFEATGMVRKHFRELSRAHVDLVHLAG